MKIEIRAKDRERQKTAKKKKKPVKIRTLALSYLLVNCFEEYMELCKQNTWR